MYLSSRNNIYYVAKIRKDYLHSRLNSLFVRKKQTIIFCKSYIFIIRLLTTNIFNIISFIQIILLRFGKFS